MGHNATVMEENSMSKTPAEIAAHEKAKADKLIADKAAADKLALDTTNGFPSGTAVDDMTLEQQVAYHKHQSRKHENRVKAMGDYDEIKARADAADKIIADNASDEEKARELARQQGEASGASKYLKPAVMAHFRAATGKTIEEVEATFEHVDAASFTDDKGEIDPAKIDTFAATFGPKGGTPNETDPVKAALERQRQAAGGSASSIGDRRTETRDRMTKKTNA